MKNVKTVPVTESMFRAAGFLAKQRLVFEYPREGYGDYGEEHLKNLLYGYIGELSFLKFVVHYFQYKYKNYKAKERFYKIKDEQFSYTPVIGQTDKGYDFIIKGKKIDVKTYGTKLLRDDNEIFKYNLLIDKRQAGNHKADIYVQAFVVGNDKPRKCILSGFYEGLPPLNEKFPHPAHALSVERLHPVSMLMQKYF